MALSLEAQKIIDEIRANLAAVSKKSEKSVKFVMEEDKHPVEIVKDEVIKLTGVVLRGFSALQQSQGGKLDQLIGKKESDITPSLKSIETTLGKRIDTLYYVIDDVVKSIRAFKVEFPPEPEDRVTKPLGDLLAFFRGFKMPSDPENPIPVRLSDGKKFYEAITQVFGTGGGGGVPKVTATTAGTGKGSQAVAVVNPDGSNISGGSGGGGDASAANQTTQITAEQAIQASVASIKTNTDPLVTSGGGGYVRQDSAGTIAKETGGNLATIKTNSDPLVTSGGGGYVRQDSTGTIAKETGGNLATVKTNTDGLAASGGGGYVRQDSTATIAKESGGNLATAVASLSVIDDWDDGADAAKVVGNIAADSADSGSPVKIGGKAVDIGANGTDVSANDRVNSYFLRSGQQLVLGGHQNIVNKHLNVTDADGAQTDVALVTVSAGTAIIVTEIEALADNANSGNVQCRIGFGTANTPSNDANTGVVLTHPGIAPGSGVVRGSGAGIVGMGASNEDLRVTCADPAGGNLDILVSYFTILIG